MNTKYLLILAGLLIITSSPAQSSTANEMMKLLRTHLDAVEDKDSLALKATLDINGSYHLILPDGSQMKTAREFYAMHQDWFLQLGWTMEMSVLESEDLGDVGTAFVEANYREADRDGKPYHHKMWITYILKKIGDEWKVVHDHASTAEKTP